MILQGIETQPNDIIEHTSGFQARIQSNDPPWLASADGSYWPGALAHPERDPAAWRIVSRGGVTVEPLFRYAGGEDVRIGDWFANEPSTGFVIQVTYISREITVSFTGTNGHEQKMNLTPHWQQGRCRVFLRRGVVGEPYEAKTTSAASPWRTVFRDKNGIDIQCGDLVAAVTEGHIHRDWTYRVTSDDSETRRNIADGSGWVVFERNGAPFPPLVPPTDAPLAKCGTPIRKGSVIVSAHGSEFTVIGEPYRSGKDKRWTIPTNDGAMAQATNEVVDRRWGIKSSTWCIRVDPSAIADISIQSIDVAAATPSAIDPTDRPDVTYVRHSIAGREMTKAEFDALPEGSDFAPTLTELEDLTGARVLNLGDGPWHRTSRGDRSAVIVKDGVPRVLTIPDDFIRDSAKANFAGLPPRRARAQAMRAAVIKFARQGEPVATGPGPAPNPTFSEWEREFRQPMRERGGRTES